MRQARQAVLMLAAAVLWAAVGPGMGARERVPAKPGADSSGPESRSVILPPPRVEGPMSLETALLARRSLRSYGERELTWAEIGQLLWAAQGETAAGRRTAPSAGALYPLELYVATSQGLHHYEPPSHRLTTLAREDRRPALRAACLDQPCAGTAPAVFVIAAVHARTAAKYGPRSVRYVPIEAGHAAQNLLLQAVALGLGGVPIGAFDDAALQRVLGLPPEHEPLYVLPVGAPPPAP